MKHAKSRAYLLTAVALLTALLGWQAARGELNQLWMIWNAPRPDTGRMSQPADPAAQWSLQRATVDRIELRKSPTPPTTESIPMPIAPGSRVTGFEIPPEDATKITNHATKTPIQTPAEP